MRLLHATSRIMAETHTLYEWRRVLIRVALLDETSVRWDETIHGATYNVSHARVASGRWYDKPWFVVGEFFLILVERELMEIGRHKKKGVALYQIIIRVNLCLLHCMCSSHVWNLNIITATRSLDKKTIECESKSRREDSVAPARRKSNTIKN